MNIYNVTQDIIDANLGRINDYPDYPLPFPFFYFVDPDGDKAITDYVARDFGITGGTLKVIDDAYVIVPIK